MQVMKTIASIITPEVNSKGSNKVKLHCRYYSISNLEGYRNYERNCTSNYEAEF